MSMVSLFFSFLPFSFSLFVNLFFCLFVFLSGCKPKDQKTAAVIRVEQGAAKPVKGAEVHLYCDSLINPGCNIDEIQTTGETGQTSHTFNNPAVLFVEAKYDTLYGKTTVTLEEGKTVNQTVRLE